MIGIGTAIANQTAMAFINHPVTVKHTVTHAPRPPAPRPVRMTVIYRMQDGFEYKEYTALTGQMSSTANFPHYVLDSIIRDGKPPESIRYEFGYEDGHNW